MSTNETPNETDEVIVAGNLISTQEFDRVKSAVCLLKPGPNDTGNTWRASGFYVHLKLITKEVDDIYCIMTNHHVAQKAKNTNEVVAVFNYEGGDKIPEDVLLEPFEIIAEDPELDYALIRLEEKHMTSLGFQPIEADGRYDPQIGDSVTIIQHPWGQKKHFSTERIERITRPFIEYFADTERGSSGSPGFVVVGSEYVLVALHCKGVVYRNKGVLISEILNHLNGICTHPESALTHGTPGQLESAAHVPTGAHPGSALAHGTPGQLESAAHVPTGTHPGSALAHGTPGQLESAAHVPTGSNKDNLVVSPEDVKSIAIEIVDCWKPLGGQLGFEDYEIAAIKLDHQDSVREKSYQMLTKWKRKKAKNATYGALAKALQHPSVDRPDLVEKYCTAKNIQ